MRFYSDVSLYDIITEILTDLLWCYVRKTMLQINFYLKIYKYRGFDGDIIRDH